MSNNIDKIFYINLDKRTDRKEEIENELKRMDLTAERYPAIYTPNSGIVGCGYSHLNVLKLAKERGYKNVLIFEDDCIFLENFENEAKKCVDELKNVEWDILYFGGEVNNYCVDVSENLVKVENGGVYCCHAYAVNKRFYDVILNVNVHHVDILDIFFLNYSSNSRTYILSRKLLAIQDSIHSDIKNGLSQAAEGYMRNSWNKFVPPFINK